MHVVVLALIGGLIGFAMPNGDVGGLLAGAALGVLVAWLEQLRARVGVLDQLRARVEELEHRTAAHAAEPLPAPRDVARPASGAPSARPTDHAAPPRAADRIVSRPRVSADAAAPAPRVASDGAAQAHRVSADAVEPSLIERGFAAVASWFTTGNVPVKVGVVLSVFGVGFLVKEAIDRNWILIPLELRLVFVALFALVLLVLGWKLRERNRVYALSVQGGGVAMLYVTIYAAFAIYGLLPAGVAFTMLFAVTAAGASLAVLQDSRTLAVLGIVGGFLAPLLTSTDSGNHVALFSYYAVLDLAIFGIAWFKAWRALNLLGFFFTFGIASLWGFDAYRPELFAATEPFLVLFVALYMLIPVLFATRRPPELRGFVDGTLVFGTPVVAFALQSQLVGDMPYGLAWTALAFAAAYGVLGLWLLERGGHALRVLAEAELGLAAAFLALAVPLALDARWTSAAWALQGAAMTWLGVRQQRPLALAAGVLLQLAAGGALVAHFFDIVTGPNGIGEVALGAAMIAVAGAFSSWCLDRGGRPGRSAAHGAIAGTLLGWATFWWLLSGVIEIGRHASALPELDAFTAFVGGTVLVATFAAPRLGWPRLNALGFVAAAWIVLAAVLSPMLRAHPLAAWGTLSWPILLASHYVFLRLRETQFPRALRALHVVSYWAIVYLLALELDWLTGRVAGGAWPDAAVLAGTAAFVLLTFRALAVQEGTNPLREALAWPLAVHRAAYVLPACGASLAVLVAGTLAANVVSPGDAAPLPYVPIANPLELATVFVLIVAYQGWKAACEVRPALSERPDRTALAFASLGLVLLTAAVARAVHHFSGVPFELEPLAASTILQAALSIVWGIAALAGMLLGARSSRREVWLAGAALMAIVVAKLFVVELGNAGTVGRVVSFLGVGVLLLVVGYFAPAPPRAALDRSHA